ncbi:hypothetical protein C6P46_004505 [Rhodotorula mucilaginosa]|uniref:Transcription elongation regulator 1 n=1 Tax=Rhodotorula mucilaginosa TaxID=5537 RepID=A0A9P6VZU3_RHOMI|nr:hypothetical protein C6P46_004505 [Rhodotorula mucilaginosa]TKA51981.1 hypothetical protein B0A53_05065 [Rhodotorula sp. CCFEE 5036]
MSGPAPPPPPGFPVAGAVPFLAPVPPPWTQHKAPNGAPYWFNPITNVSTYVRPAAALPPPPPPGFAVAAAAPPAPAQLPALHYTPQAPAPAKKKDKKEKPKLKTRLGETNWTRVVTNKGNVFYNDSETKQSVWTVPEEVKHLVEELEQKEREEAEQAAAAKEEEQEKVVTEEAQQETFSSEGTRKKRKAEDDEEGGAGRNRGEGEEEEEEEEEEDDGQERGHLEIEIEVETEGGDTSIPERPVAAASAAAAGGPPPAKKPKLSSSEEAAPSTDASGGGNNVTTGGRGDPNDTSSPPSLSSKQKQQEPEQADQTPPQNPDGDTDDKSETKNQKKKKKQKKPKVVSSLEDLADEDWQRQIADEMAREAEAEAEAAAAEADAPGAPNANAQPEQQQQQQPQVAGGLAQRMEVDQVEAAALFTVLLSEKEINPMAPFETELPKFVTDPRYHAVKGQKERRDLFDQFCKDKIREQRAAKRRAAESGIKVDPLTAYRQLLSTTVTSTRTHFSDFKRQHAKDARFREFGKMEGEREKEFKKWLRELGERKRAEAERAEREFGEMLRLDGQIKSGDKWAEVKKRHASDPRYAAVNSSSLREQLFEKHLASLASSSGSHHPSRTAPVASTSSSSTKPAQAPSKEDKAARAAASLREREEKVRLEKMRNARSAERARGHLGKDEAEREFAQLLVDAVRDHNARFDDVAPTLAADPRFDAPSLHPSDKRRLFDAHQQKLYRSRVGDVESLFAAHASSLTTPFDAVLPAISSDPHVTRLVGSDFTQLEALYDGWLARRTRQAREDFTQMLKENSVLEHWGRMKKMEKREKGKLIGEEGVREDSEDEEPDAREMAEQIDLKAIHAVLRNDKRYLEFDHVPEDRERWVEDYVNNLAAPKTTVHQRE